MFTDTKYSVKGGSGAGVRDAANYLFKEMAAYLENGKEHDIEGIGLSRVYGHFFDSLGIPTKDAMGKDIPVDKERFIHMMKGEHPNTGEPLKKWQKEHHPGSEILIAPDLDINIIYSRASLSEKKLIRELYQESVADTLKMLESEVVKIRITERDPITGKKVKRDITPNGGVCFMEFNHFESRMVQEYVDNGTQTRPDCNIHSHISAPNVAMHNGKIYSLENSYLKNAQVKADMLMKNKFYNSLADKMGLRFERELVEKKPYQKRSKESYRFKIVGITDEMRAVHGHRTQALEAKIEQLLKEKIAAKVAEYESQGKPVPASVYNIQITPEEEKQISRDMRASKMDFSQKTMTDSWAQEWDAKGFSHDALENLMEQGKAVVLEQRFEKAHTPEQLIDLLTAKQQSFTQKDFRDLYLQNNAATGKSYEQLKEEIAVSLRDFGVELKDEEAYKSHKGRQLEGEDFSRVFTSKKLHEAEKSSLAWVIENKDRQSRVSISEAEAIKGIREWEKLKSKEEGKLIRLNAEQMDAAISMCTGKGVITLIAGHAGTGKTFSIQAANHCLQNFTQAGSAVSGRGAENLSIEGLGGAQATSVAAFLQRYKLEGGKGKKIEIPQILWLDEAATANSMQMAEILKIGAKDNADFRVICSYDFKQTEAIGASGLLKDIEKACGSIELKAVQRQKTVEGLKVAELARDGDLSELKQHMKDQKRFDGSDGWYSVAKDRNAQIEELAGLYMKQQAPAKEKLVVGLLRRDVEDLNAKIREARIADGQIEQGIAIRCSYKDDESALAVGHTRRDEKLRNFAQGDRIIIKEGFKLKTGSGKSMVIQHLMTGYAGEIIDQKSDGFMSVRFDNGKVASWNASKDGQNSVDHFYAGTVNSTQGASVVWCAAMDAGFQDKNFAQAEAANQQDQATAVAKEMAELGESRNQLYTMLSRHKLEANLITTEALDSSFETRYGAYGLKESTLDKVLEPKTAVEKSIEPVDTEWAKLDLEEHQTKLNASAAAPLNNNNYNPKENKNGITKNATERNRQTTNRLGSGFERTELQNCIVAARRAKGGLQFLHEQHLNEPYGNREQRSEFTDLLQGRDEHHLAGDQAFPLRSLGTQESESTGVKPVGTKAPPRMRSLSEVAFNTQSGKAVEAKTPVFDRELSFKLLNQHFRQVSNGMSIDDFDLRELLQKDADNGIVHDFNSPAFEDGDSFSDLAIKLNYGRTLEDMIKYGAEITPEQMKVAKAIDQEKVEEFGRNYMLEGMEAAMEAALKNAEREARGEPEQAAEQPTAIKPKREREMGM
jgi:hypothetical protein